MILKSGKNWNPDPQLIEDLALAYPTVDLTTELHKMRVWTNQFGISTI